MKKTTSKDLSIATILVMILLIFFSAKLPQAEAATITLYPTCYTYVKPAPYWPCNPYDEFTESQQVTILERDYDTFYIEYTKDGQLKRGYVPMSNFNAADYAGYSWCNHTYYMPAKNNTNGDVTTYFGPSASHAATGKIDFNEGISSLEPLMLLRYEGSRAFVQYVTNPSSTGHARFKRAWVDSSSITRLPKATAEGIPNNGYAIIRNAATGNALELTSLDANGNYTISANTLTGYQPQHLQITQCGDALTGSAYRIASGWKPDRSLEIEHKTAVVDNALIGAYTSSPNKAQEYYIEKNSDGTYKISTRCSGGYLSLESKPDGSAVFQNKPSSSTYQKWYIESFNKYYDRSYYGLSSSNGIIEVKYYIKTSGDYAITKAEATVNQITTAINDWNSYSSITGIQFIRVYSSTNATININANILDSTYTYAQTTITPKAGSENSFFDNSEITLNTLCFHTLSDNRKIAVIAHELGHSIL